MTTPGALRAQFPVASELAYLNAGTCGPLPRAAVAAATEALEHGLRNGRADEHFERLETTATALRGAYAALLGASAEDIALTTAASEGIVRVLLGLGLRPGDEVLIAEGEHPGLLGPLGALRRDGGVAVRAVAALDLADAVSPATKLIACSHVAWTSGTLAPDLAGVDVPVLIDGAQGLGAVPTDVAALGCDFYAAAGQKWLCGPIGTGLLYVAPARREQLRAAAPTFNSLERPAEGLDALPWSDARAHDAHALPLDAIAAAMASHDVLAAFGWSAVHERGRKLARELGERLEAGGRSVAPRSETTLVSWNSEDPAAEVRRLRQAGVVTRSFPGRPWVRASVGAWNDHGDLERLLAVACA